METLRQNGPAGWGVAKLMSKFLKFTNKSRVSMLSGRQVRSQFIDGWRRNNKKKKLPEEKSKAKKKNAFSRWTWFQIANRWAGVAPKLQSQFSWRWLTQRKVTSSERCVQVSDGLNTADGSHVKEISTLRTVKIHWLGNKIEHELLYAW